MNLRTQSHHCISKILSGFSGKSVASGRERSFSRLKAARAYFASTGEKKVDVIGANIPFSEIPSSRFPALYFTRLGQHPVVIEKSTPMGYSIRLWDGRESLCERRRLEKTLEPVGYFVSEGTGIRKNAKDRLVAELKEERSHLLLGAGNGLVTCSLLVVFVFLLHHAFQSAFPMSQINSFGLALVGILAAVLSTCGFLQARYLIGEYFESLSETNRSREIKMPPPFPVQALTNVVSGRSIVEAAFSPFLLVAAAVMIGYDLTSIAVWSAFFGCVIPAFIFLFKFPGLINKWNQALWFYEEKEQPESVFEVEEDEPEETVELTPRVIFDTSVVRAHNLYLAHPEESRAPLIDHISLKVEECGKVGFLGKSSGDVPVFLRVISGMLNSDRGLVWLNGKMVDGDQSNHIGWFSEKASLIDGSLRDNLFLNDDGVDPKSIVKLTGLDQISCFQDQGLDAPVLESGRGMSGEEKVRILLARALVNQPRLLIFDAPLELAHFEVFHEIVAGYLAMNRCTLLLGAKRPAQLDLVDRVIFLEDGKISSDGPVAEMIPQIESDPVSKS